MSGERSERDQSGRDSVVIEVSPVGSVAPYSPDFLVLGGQDRKIKSGHLT